MQTLREQNFLPVLLDLIEKGGNRRVFCNELHEGVTCGAYTFNKLFKTFKISLNVFFLVHILPSIIFRFKQFKENPIKTTKKTLISYFRSVMFLALITAVPFCMVCKIGKWRGKTDVVTFKIIKALGDLGCIFEQASR